MRNRIILTIGVIMGCIIIYTSCSKEELVPENTDNALNTEMLDYVDLNGLAQTDMMTNPDVPRGLLRDINMEYQNIVQQVNSSYNKNSYNSLDPDLVIDGNMLKGIIRPVKNAGDTVDIAEGKVIVDTSPNGNLIFGAGDIVIEVNIISNNSNDDATDVILRETNLYQDANNFENKELIELDLLNTPTEYVDGYWDIETIPANSYRIKSIVYIAPMVSVPTVIFSNTTVISTLERELNKANNHATPAFGVNP